MNITVRIKRYDPDVDPRPRWQEFSMEVEPMDVLTC